MAHPKCEDCRFWDTSVTSEDGVASPCRKLPPVADDRDHSARWPMTEETDWCGAFEQDPDRVEEIDDEPLSDAPPDGAAEREALVPAPKWFGYRTTPAPTEAPAADWRSAHDAWWCGADSKYREQHGVAFEAGYRAGMFAARPAAVTDAMVEAACRIDRRWASWARDDEERTAALRVEVRDMLAAALAARGPA